MNNSVFGKAMDNVRKYRNIKLVTTKRRRDYLASEPNYHTTKFFYKKLISNRNKKSQILMNESLLLGLWILDLIKALTYEFWYDYVKPKYGENAKPCYLDTDSFLVHVETDDIYKDIAEDVDKRFDTFNF